MNEPHLRRHDRAFVAAHAWDALVKSRADFTGEPLLAAWAARGWPLVVRRSAPGEAAGVALGLPLPPSAGKRRIAVVMRRDDIARVAPPLALRDAIAAAPGAWQSTLSAIEGVARRYRGHVHVFGSLAWQTITGLAYLRPESDLDLLVSAPRDGLAELIAGLSAIQNSAPMRLDGEIVRPDGAAAHWSELRDGEGEVLVKTLRGVALMSVESFLGKVSVGQASHGGDYLRADCS